MRATPHGYSRTCAYCRRMSPRCRSRHVIALRPASASASIGTSTIGVGYSRVASSMLPATEASSDACGAGSATVTIRRVSPRPRARSPARTNKSMVSPVRGRALRRSVTLSSFCVSSGRGRAARACRARGRLARLRAGKLLPSEEEKLREAATGPCFVECEQRFSVRIDPSPWIHRPPRVG